MVAAVPAGSDWSQRYNWKYCIDIQVAVVAEALPAGPGLAERGRHRTVTWRSVEQRAEGRIPGGALLLVAEVTPHRGWGCMRGCGGGMAQLLVPRTADTAAGTVVAVGTGAAVAGGIEEQEWGPQAQRQGLGWGGKGSGSMAGRSLGCRRPNYYRRGWRQAPAADGPGSFRGAVDPEGVRAGEKGTLLALPRA